MVTQLELLDVQFSCIHYVVSFAKRLSFICGAKPFYTDV